MKKKKMRTENPPADQTAGGAEVALQMWDVIWSGLD